MIVDQGRSLGFATAAANDGALHLFDLDRLTLVGVRNTIQDGVDPTTLGLDTDRQRLYVTGAYPTTNEAANNTDCDLGTGGTRSVRVFSYAPQPSGQRALQSDSVGPMPCTGPGGAFRFFGLAGSYYAPTDRLYVAGVPAYERWRQRPSGTHPIPSVLGDLREDRGQALLIRQMKVEGDAMLSEVGGDPAKASQFKLEWEVDLRHAGCGRRDPVSVALFEAFVARVGDDVTAGTCARTEACPSGPRGTSCGSPCSPGPTASCGRP
jgi:hypothetical protein